MAKRKALAFAVGFPRSSKLTDGFQGVPVWDMNARIGANGTARGGAPILGAFRRRSKSTLLVLLSEFGPYRAND